LIDTQPSLGLSISEEVAMNVRSVLSAALAAIFLGLVSAPQVRADSIDSFVYQSEANTFTWELPSSPIVTPGNASPGNSFTLLDVSVSENGGTAAMGTMDFFSDPGGLGVNGGIDFFVGNFFYLINATGPQVYSGPETSPTFLIGTFNSFTEYGNGFVGVPGGTLQISKAVPEPSALLLLVLGLGLTFAIYIVGRLAPLRSIN
jgi:hypothetical protein